MLPAAALAIDMVWPHHTLPFSTPEAANSCSPSPPGSGGASAFHDKILVSWSDPSSNAVLLWLITHWKEIFCMDGVP